MFRDVQECSMFQVLSTTLVDNVEEKSQRYGMCGRMRCGSYAGLLGDKFKACWLVDDLNVERWLGVR